MDFKQYINKELKESNKEKMSLFKKSLLESFSLIYNWSIN